MIATERDYTSRKWSAYVDSTWKDRTGYVSGCVFHRWPKQHGSRRRRGR